MLAEQIMFKRGLFDCLPTLAFAVQGKFGVREKERETHRSADVRVDCTKNEG